MDFLSTRGNRIVNQEGQPVTLRGLGLAGWLTMENWITGFPAHEEGLRHAVRRVLGERADVYFERFLEHFFTEADAEWMRSMGFNVVRIPLNYRHIEDDMNPFVIKEEGFRHLDRAIDICARHGIYSIIDLHAVPGWQNMGWHADNPTHVTQFFQHKHFQDRTANLWRAIAGRYRDNPNVAAYNPMNEPVEPDNELFGRLSLRMVDAIREVDTKHIILLDGNRFCTDFSAFHEALPNVVYSAHFYVLSGFVPNAPYPGWCPYPYEPPEVLFPEPGVPVPPDHERVYIDRDAAERTFLEHNELMFRTGTPILVGECNVVFTGDPEHDAMRLRLLEDQLDIMEKHEASWVFWGFKDLGLVSPLTVDPESPYARRVRPIVEKKARLGVDEWGRRHDQIRHVMSPLKALIKKEFPNLNTYPWGGQYMTERLVTQILFSEALLPEYAELFRGMDEAEIDEMMRSFRFERCLRREPVIAAMRHATGHVPA